jgi:hypothetical protein
MKMTIEGIIHLWPSTREDATGRGEWWEAACKRSLLLRPPSPPKLFFAGDENDLYIHVK